MVFRILIVEDDPVSCEIVKSLLAGRGYEIDSAEDGFGALRTAQERVYDLVLIDYHLPEMDGYALARLMRSLGEKTNPGMKMIAITADRFGLAARRGVDTIFDALLTKPIDPAAFPGLIAEMLGSSSALEELEGFLGAVTPAEAATAPGLALWRTRGLGRVPAARVFPTPTAAERGNIEHCFHIVDDAAAADCLILLRDAGLAEVEALRREGSHYLLPLLAVSKDTAPVADALFEPGDGDSWTAVAQAISGFATRRATLSDDLVAATSLDLRLLAFLHVCGRDLVLQRGADGVTLIPQASGFRNADIVASVKTLLSKDLVTTTIDKEARTLTVRPKLESTVSRHSRAIEFATDG